MNIRDRRSLKAAARESLGAAPGHRRLILISAGAAAALSLMVSLLSYLLDGQIAQTGGLDGMGLRSILSTAQSLLSMGIGVALPFWSLGYISATLKLARKEPAEPAALLEGFRRFWPALRLLLSQQLIYIGVVLLCIYVGGAVLSFTPLAAPLYEVMLPVMEGLSAGAEPDAATLEQVMDAMVPIAIGVAVLSIAALIPVAYRLRMAQLRLMDRGCGAMAALRDSSRMMRGNCFALFRLDLSFWWFYAVQALAVLLGYGDVLLAAAGVTLPISDGAAYFLFYAAGLLMQLLLSWYAQNFVEVTYAKAYDALLDAPAEKPKPQSVPWNY